MLMTEKAFDPRIWHICLGPSIIHFIWPILTQPVQWTVSYDNFSECTYQSNAHFA